MMNFAFLHSFALFAAAQAAESDHSGYKYSIRAVFDWNLEAIRNIVNWGVQNGPALLAGVVKVAFTVAFCWVVFLLIRRVIGPLLEKWHRYVAEELMAISGPAVRLIFWCGLSNAVDSLSFSEEVHEAIDKLFYVCFVLEFVNIIQHALRCTISLLIDRFKKKDPKNYIMNKLMLDLARSIIRLMLWLYATIFILQEVFHLGVTHLIASAGIVGVAVAFAAKDTIANIFGAFSILGGKMFRVGDWIKAGSSEGLVEQIGFRSIRIRAFSDGRLIDIPNHLIADTQIENFSTHLYWREHFCFGLVYQTTPEQMALAKQLLNEIGHDLADLMFQGKPLQFDFILFGQSSLDLDGYVWFKASDWLSMRRARGRFNEEVQKRFCAAGLEFAFPTTTVVMEPPAKE